MTWALPPARKTWCSTSGVRSIGWSRWAHVKVSYDTGRTRQHAKAWLFIATRFSTAFIGASNPGASGLRLV